MKKFLKKGQKGFTLIELLIVIVILGVLAAAIIPNLSKFVTSGDVGAANQELASVRTGISAFIADHSGDAPAAIGDLATYVTGTVKGVYTWDADTGEVTDAANGTWSAKISFEGTTNGDVDGDGVTSLKWVTIP